jgi:hypothetical protein
MGPDDEQRRILPVLLDGNHRDSFPPLLEQRVCADFRDETNYFPALFDVILTIHDMSFGDPAIIDLRDRLRRGEPPAGSTLGR